MSTMSSPRPSITSARTPTPTGSRRPSVDSLAVSIASTPTHRAPSPSITHRRNRAALRDYYNLRSNRTEPSVSIQPSARSAPRAQDSLAPQQATPITNTELDNPSFDPSAYVSHLLSTSSLSTILRAENSLVSDIRTLDGERKALVYDNYSKLIKAVETIGKMRTTLEEEGAPMIMTKTLGPAIGFVAETAGTLIKEQEEMNNRGNDEIRQLKDRKSPDKQTVRWVLDTPRRLRVLLEEDKTDDAERDWEEIKQLLAKWERVKGVEELKRECEAILKQER
ncbi:uncharacterized protein CIMG_12006 [Coccidioides immitis RS]|uniref:Vacuolar protein sorting-associated protein 51 homolog n=2 Tax=Coccidioides immitis TaxID=5501 RepID=A0A0D8JUT8_COCIM|nr:uncharacterized protein CIMG_12006 [Coccidioides immitis RS]KJF60909.1 hypothetical protein CIMG_12006 [Coccidioides immitis RS]KMU87744.1 hypothetical protein CIHG_05513 [Coccidioides immitis H538.4]